MKRLLEIGLAAACVHVWVWYASARPPEPAPELVERLTHADKHVRVKALRQLGELGTAGKHAVEAVAPLLRDKEPDVRVQAGRTLAQIGSAALPVLMKEMTLDDYSSRYRAARNLAAMGPLAKDAVPVLIASLTHSHPDPRSMSAFALGEIGPAAWKAGPGLVRRLSDEDGEVRKQARVALIKIGPDVIPTLAGALQSPQAPIRQAAAEILANLGAPAKSALPDLLTALKDKQGPVRRAAALTIAVLGSEAQEALQPLIEALTDKEPGVRMAAAQALGELGPQASPAIAALTNAFRDGNQEVRVQSVLALVKIGPEAARVLVNTIFSDNYQMRVNAIFTLGQMGPAAKNAGDSLIEAMKERDPGIRGASALALGRIGPAIKADATRPLQLVLEEDGRDSIRIAAALALVQLYPNDPAAANQLTKEVLAAAGNGVGPVFKPINPAKEAKYSKFLDFFIYRNSFSFGLGLDCCSRQAMEQLDFDAIPAMVRAYNFLASTGPTGKIIIGQVGNLERGFNNPLGGPLPKTIRPQGRELKLSQPGNNLRWKEVGYFFV